MRGPSIATSPSLTGSVVLAAPWAMVSVPNPASFENSPLRTPITIMAPKAPPMAESPVNASVKIREIIPGTSVIFLPMMMSAAKKYSPTIPGTSLDATLPIFLIPPKITIQRITPTISPVNRLPACGLETNHPFLT